MAGPALPAAPANAPASVTETGSTLLFPLFGTWSTAYQKLYPQVTITTGGTGSGTGITDAATGTVNIGASDAYLSSADTSQYPGLLNIALAISAQQINYNVPGVKHLKLDGPSWRRSTRARSPTGTTPPSRRSTPASTLPSLKIITAAPRRQLGRHLPVHQLPERSGPEWLAVSNVNTMVSWPSVAGALAETGNSGMVAGVPGQQGLHRLHRHQLPAEDAGRWPGRGVAEERGGQVRAAHSRDHRRRRGRLHQQDPGQRDHLDDQRPGGRRLPDRQLRVRHREDQAGQRHPGGGHPGVPALDRARRAERRRPTWTRWTSRRCRPAWWPSPTRRSRRSAPDLVSTSAPVLRPEGEAGTRSLPRLRRASPPGRQRDPLDRLCLRACCRRSPSSACC